MCADVKYSGICISEVIESRGIPHHVVGDSHQQPSRAGLYQYNRSAATAVCALTQ